MQCAICGNTKNNKIHIAKEMMLGIRDEHEYLECDACGCLHILNIPDNLPAYYPDEDYYSYEQIKSHKGIKKLLVKLRDRYAATGSCFIGKLLNTFMPQSKLQTLQKTGISKHSRILDVGCGAGHLLHSLQETGFDNLLGIDPFNAKDIHYENGLSIKKKSIHDMTENDWDLIMFHHSFEHVADQEETLSKAASMLKPGGTCLIRIPTVSSWAWQHYGVNWVQLDAPRHLYLHSIKSLQTLAEKMGLKLEDVVYDSFAFQLWGSNQYEKDTPLNDEGSYAVNPDKSPFTKENIAAFERKSAELNKNQQGDQAAFYLKKPV